MTNIVNIDLPVISNISEASDWCHDFKSVLTVGPNAREVQWNHPNHRVYTFGDTTRGLGAPTLPDVLDAVSWGAEQEDLLVHCHAGMSRSTSISWGIAIARGADPLEAFLALKDAHPVDRYGKRDFIPNALIVKHLTNIFNIPNLDEIRIAHSTAGWFN